MMDLRTSPPPVARTGLAKAVLAASVLVFAMATTGMLRGDEPWRTWYYSLAWWPYILGIESWLALRGEPTLLYSRPGRFLVVSLLSVSVWLVFEAFNFRLNNWEYLNLPASLPVRWAGYFLAFATVLPGVFATRDLLAHLGAFSRTRVKPLADAHRLHAPLFVIGAVMLILPLAWPRYFFPLVWGGFVLALEPIAHKFGGDSLLADWEAGRPAEFYRLLGAGAICGGLWELWNFWAGAKWVYTVPFVGDLKLFEMPVAGFLGFPPFAVECAVISSVFFLVANKLGKTRLSRMFLVCAVMLAIGFDLAVFAGIDRFTVVSFAAPRP